MAGVTQQSFPHLITGLPSPQGGCRKGSWERGRLGPKLSWGKVETQEAAGRARRERHPQGGGETQKAATLQGG